MSQRQPRPVLVLLLALVLLLEVALHACTPADGASSAAPTSAPPATTVDSFDDRGFPTSASLLDCAVGPLGRCVGGTLTRCSDTGLVHTTCGDADRVCAYAGDSIGYACVAPAAAPPLEVSGQIFYQDRPVSPGQLGPLTAAPVRGASVWVMRTSDEAVLARAITADDGSYVLRYQQPTGTQVRVAVAASSQVAVRPVRVVRDSGATHALLSTSFPAAPSRTTDLIATEPSGMAPAFNVFDTLITGLDHTRRHGAAALVPLTAHYQRGSNSGSWYDGTADTITLAGGPDDDGYDDVVILHEFGHHHQDEYGWSDSPGGAHPNPGGDDPRLAWGEGEATYLAMAFRGAPHYIDTNSVDGGWYLDLEQRRDFAKPDQPMSQLVLEWMVAEIMWDMGDDALGQDRDHDAVVGSHADAVFVTASYFRHPAFADRGVGGVDLVDWLDGWFARTGASQCSATRTLLAGYYFPYDFTGPTPCP